MGGIMKTSLTIDTNLLMEYWRNRNRMQVVEQLLSLADEGSVDLAITSRIREDVPNPPLAQRINQLSELGIQET